MKSIAALVFALTVALSAWAEVPDKPTFAKDVAPIFYENCVGCHSPGQIAPMSLQTYKEVRPWVKSIEKNVGNRTMPPWHADPGYGKFANDRSLSDDEIATIVTWAKQGAPLGDKSDLPKPPRTKKKDEWQLGKPDYVFEFKEVTIQPGETDRFYDLSARLDLPEDKFVRAVEILPGNSKVLHHVILESSGDQDGWLAAWAAGTPPMVFREGTGRRIKKNARIVGDMHYHPAETAENDRTQVGLYFADEPGKEMVNLWIVNQNFYIPAGDANYQVTANYTFSQDAHIHALFPHMHFRGKDFTYTAVYPDGRSETLMRVSDYDFNWQTYYVLEEPLPMPKGTRIECVAHYDNSENNPDNPDPTRSLGWGDESYDEMMIGFVDFTVDEGLVPESPENAVKRIAQELVAAGNGDVYDVKISLGFQAMASTLHIPAEGNPVWHIAAMGVVRESQVSDIQRNGDEFTCKVAIAGLGTFDCSGTYRPEEGTVSGKIILPEESGPESLTFNGTKLN